YEDHGGHDRGAASPSTPVVSQLANDLVGSPRTAQAGPTPSDGTSHSGIQHLPAVLVGFPSSDSSARSSARGGTSALLSGAGHGGEWSPTLLFVSLGNL